MQCHCYCYCLVRSVGRMCSLFHPIETDVSTHIPLVHPGLLELAVVDERSALSPSTSDARRRVQQHLGGRADKRWNQPIVLAEVSVTPVPVPGHHLVDHSDRTGLTCSQWASCRSNDRRRALRHSTSSYRITVTSSGVSRQSKASSVNILICVAQRWQAATHARQRTRPRGHRHLHHR